MTAGYRAHVSVPMTDTWRSRLHQSMLSRMPGTMQACAWCVAIAFCRVPQSRVLVHSPCGELALLQKGRGWSTRGTPTLGTTGRMCLCQTTDRRSCLRQHGQG